ncbi:MAG: polysaccharide pyruvyl transferase family protein [bacterium]
MRLGLIGWYGHENAGDERMLFCLRQFFGGSDFLVTAGLDDALARIEDLNRCDYVLFGGGGLILRGFGIYAPLIERLKARFGCVGISVEACHSDNLRLIEVIKDRAEFILVRDEASRKLFGCHFKVIVGPDVSFLYPFEIIDPVSSDTCGVNLRPWPYWRGEHGGRYDRWMQRLNHRFPILERIYPLQKWKPEGIVKILQDNFSRLVPVPLYTEAGGETDSEFLRPFFDEVDDVFSPDSYLPCRYFAGMRLHSLIFACQMGIPFLSLSYQPKNAEFCKAAGMEQLSIDLFNLAELAPGIGYLKKEYSGIRENLLDFREKSRQEIHAIMRAIFNNVATAAVRCCVPC